MKHRLEQACIHLIFLLGTILVFQLGISAAHSIIHVGRAKQVDVINRVVEQISVGVDTKKAEQAQDIALKYAGAYLRAIAGFQFVPRNDLDTLAGIISATPLQTSVRRMEYSGRDLTIRTIQPEFRDAQLMVRSLEDCGLFSNVIYHGFVNNEGDLEANITCIAYHYEPISFWEGISEFLDTVRQFGRKSSNENA